VPGRPVTRDPHKRAKNSDRDACVEVIEAAYVDGQLSDADREIRVGNALAASTLGELDQLTRDLQTPHPPLPRAVVVQPSQAPAPQTVPVQWTELRPTYVRRPSAMSPKLGLAVLAMVVLSIGATVFTSFVRSVSESDFGNPVGIEQVDDPYDLSSTGVDAFLDLYEAKFGNTRVVRAVFYGEYVVLDVPTADGKNRSEGWLYQNGRWTKTADARTNSAGGKVIDLRQVNLARLERNIAQAKVSLNVENPETVYLIVDHAPYDAGPTVRIYVSNQFSESGYLATDFTGREETARYPFGG
jgi:DUF1707 SHOCT-like domain